jgi:NitT/TauT family transport system ATP-binding protein
VRVKVSHLTVTFDANPAPVTALRDVSFETGENEFLTFIGPSGCGKTTLLRAVSGLVTPRTGSVERLPAPADRNQQLLLVFQEDSVFPWLTVLDNATFGLRMQAVPAVEREARARVLLERFGLAGRERAYPHQLSLGMKQRVAVIRCFLSDPAVMLMDEPFAALDAQTRMTLQQELLSLWEQSPKTVVFVTHDIEEAILLSDRVLILDGPPGAIVHDIRVPFARPRRPTLVLDAAFLELKRTIWSRLAPLTNRHAVVA